MPQGPMGIVVLFLFFAERLTLEFPNPLPCTSLSRRLVGKSGPQRWKMKAPTNAAGPHTQRPRRIVFPGSAGVSSTPSSGLHLPQARRSLTSVTGLSVPQHCLGTVNLSRGLHHQQNYKASSDQPGWALSLPPEPSGNCRSRSERSEVDLAGLHFPQLHGGSKSQGTLSLKICLKSRLPGRNDQRPFSWVYISHRALGTILSPQGKASVLPERLLGIVVQAPSRLHAHLLGRPTTPTTPCGSHAQTSRRGPPTRGRGLPRGRLAPAAAGPARGPRRGDCGAGCRRAT